MKLVHWFSLAALVVGVALLFAGLTTAGCVILAIAPVIELIHAAVTGKQTNKQQHSLIEGDSTHMPAHSGDDDQSVRHHDHMHAANIPLNGRQWPGANIHRSHSFRHEKAT